jgi:hypothetical protein
MFKKHFLLSCLIIFSLNSYSQSFYTANGNYLGKVEFYSQVQRNCGNCGVLLDKSGTKIGEVSPGGGYRQFKSNNGNVICSWSMDKDYFTNNNRRYSAVKDKKQTNGYIIYDGNEKIASAKIKGLKINFYSTNGNLLMIASCSTNAFGEVNGHDFDVSTSYFLNFRY